MIIPNNVNKDNILFEVKSSRPEAFSEKDLYTLYEHIQQQDSNRVENPSDYNSWVSLPINNGVKKVVGIFILAVDAQAWFILLSSEEQFYQPVNKVARNVVLIICISIIILSLLVFFFVNFISDPLTDCVETIKDITDSMDFSKRVKIQYMDEIGILGQYFNEMIQELEKNPIIK